VTVSIVQEDATTLRDYARVPISFSARTIYDVSTSPSGEIRLTKRELDTPIEKDYDSTSEGPTVWPVTFDISNWAFFGAFLDGTRVGGATVALRARDVEMLEGRDDLAVLWDLRVAPEHRGKGIGAALIEAAGEWARANGATTLKVETQNINVPACRRYGASGFVVRKANIGAYSDFPDEVQLLWYKDLSSSSTGDRRNME
jgi:GNAT superfamily N-acetyltransferase